MVERFPRRALAIAATMRLTAGVLSCLLAVTLLGWTDRAVAQQSYSHSRKPPFDVTGYVMDLDVDPQTHHISANVKVTFVPNDALELVVFDLHNALKISKATDTAGKVLQGERPSDSTIRLTPTSPLVKGVPVTWTFVYEGTLTGEEEGPVEGLKLLSIGDPITYLLYPGRWFPQTGYLTDRFTAEIHVKAPAGYTVVGSGSMGPAKAAGAGQEWFYKWAKPGFPGTLIIGKFEPPSMAGVANVRAYVTAEHKAAAAELAKVAASEHDFFSGSFGTPESPRLNIVELPTDTVPAFWAPEIAAISGTYLSGRTGQRLLANTIARQWWGSQISPATLNDAWLTNGMSRYAELIYVEDTQGKAALNSAVLDISAGALAYDTIPLAQTGRLNAFSPEFQSMTLEKGSMVFHMLRWQVGDELFGKMLKGLLNQFEDKPVSTDDFEKAAEALTQQQLTPFFAQWLDGTGAPQFVNKYSVYRLGNNKGFRTIGQIGQDLDLFSMPVELRIETDGKTETQRVNVVGTDSQYVVDTFGRPRHISLDPDNWLLKNSPDLQVRVSILRGQQLAAQGDSPGALAEYQKALEANPQSSLASYRVGEVLFTQRNYQAAVNAYRDALNGDGEPRWTQVWSHIQIGKIFDVTGQRDRAVNEYRLAVRTNDNTQGALNEARLYLQKPYKRPEN